MFKLIIWDGDDVLNPSVDIREFATKAERQAYADGYFEAFRDHSPYGNSPDALHLFDYELLDDPDKYWDRIAPSHPRFQDYVYYPSLDDLRELVDWQDPNTPKA